MKLLTIVFTLSLVFFIGCDKEKAKEEVLEAIEDSTSNIVDSAIGEVSSSAGAIEGGNMRLQNAALERYSISPVSPQAACSLDDIRSSSCTTGTDSNGYTYGQKTIEFGGCTVGTATVTGTITETWMGMGVLVCAMNGDGANLSRVISETNPKVVTFASGATLTVDHAPGTAYDGTTFPNAAEGTIITRTHSNSNGLTCSSGADSNACYNVVGNGLHRVKKGPKGRTWFEHIIDTNLTVKGSKGAGTRTVAGTTTIWHQTAQYKATNTFNTVQWTDASCCYPTSGSVTTVLEGSITGNTTTTFTTTCGQATYLDSDSVEQTITLKQCQ